MSDGNPHKTKHSRLAADSTPNVSYTDTDQFFSIDVRQNGITTVESHHANTPVTYTHHPSGAHKIWHKDGSFSVRGAGESRFEYHGMTVTTSENIDIASGGMITVKTVGGVEAQISGDGQITIGGDAIINIMGNAGVAIKGNALITAGENVSVKAGGTAAIEAESATVLAEDITMTASDITLNGDMQFVGDIRHTGSITTSGTHTDSIGQHDA